MNGLDHLGVQSLYKNLQQVIEKKKVKIPIKLGEKWEENSEEKFNKIGLKLELETKTFETNNKNYDKTIAKIKPDVAEVDSGSTVKVSIFTYTKAKNNRKELTPNHHDLVTVPYLINNNETEAIERIERSNLKDKIIYIYTDDVQLDSLVKSQKPKSNKMVPANSNVLITVYRYKYKYVVVPNITNLTKEEVIDTLRKLGFSPNSKEKSTDDSTLFGKVIKVKPEPGTYKKMNSKVTVYIGIEKQPTFLGFQNIGSMITSLLQILIILLLFIAMILQNSKILSKLHDYHLRDKERITKEHKKSESTLDYINSRVFQILSNIEKIIPKVNDISLINRELHYLYIQYQEISKYLQIKYEESLKPSETQLPTTQNLSDETKEDRELEEAFSLGEKETLGDEAILLRNYNNNQQKFKTLYKTKAVAIINANESVQAGIYTPVKKPKFGEKDNGVFLLIEGNNSKLYILPYSDILIKYGAVNLPQIKACFEIENEHQLNKGSNINVVKCATCSRNVNVWLLDEKGKIVVLRGEI